MKNLVKFVFPVLAVLFLVAATTDWNVPEKAKNQKNPYVGQGIDKGNKLYEKNCVACHLADGTGMDAIVKNVDFTTEAFQKQTDGAIHYKIVEGKEGSSMRAYGDDFSDKNIWYMVNYIRTLKK